MSGRSRRRTAGFSVAETLVAALVVTVVVGAAMALVAKTHEASRESAPEIERTVRRAAALAEIRSTISCRRTGETIMSVARSAYSVAMLMITLVWYTATPRPSTASNTIGS